MKWDILVKDLFVAYVLSVFFWLSGEYLSKAEKCVLCSSTCSKCTGPGSKDCISCPHTRWSVNKSLVSHSTTVEVTVRQDVHCVGKDLSFYSFVGFLIMGHAWSTVILGSMKGTDSVIFVTTHAWNVLTGRLTNALAVAKVNGVIMTASHNREKYKLLM